MLDPKLWRQDIAAVAKRLEIRGFKLDVARINQLEDQRKSVQVETEQLQSKRNSLSKAIGVAKANGESVDSIMQEVSALGERLAACKTELEDVQEKLQAILFAIPNLPHVSVPAGKDENDNVELRQVGEIPQFSFKPKEHFELGEALGLMDFAASAKITGSRFVVLRGQLVRLQRALTQLMIDTHVSEHGYQEIYVPYMVNRDSLYGTGQLPKFEEDQFKLAGHHEYYLIPTAEVPVTNTVRDTIVEPQALPIKYVCHTPCFRSEAGSYGKDTTGMFRQHQFEKVELVWVTKPDESYAVLETLTQHAEMILQKLELPYRVVTLCGADIGFCAAKTYDLEVWLAGQNRYREISSCSNFEDFQARRMQARWRNPETGKPELLHTLNGSALAVGRTLIAVMEHGQDEQGRIHLPSALWPYMGGVKVIDY